MRYQIIVERSEQAITVRAPDWAGCSVEAVSEERAFEVICAAIDLELLGLCEGEEALSALAEI